MNNKISEKAVWDKLVPSDKTNPPVSPYGQSVQPQIMSCYKCSETIPENSKFCPLCGIELYTLCPKCGKKYSSQYRFCNECGTNKDSYTQEQSMLECKKLFEERIKDEFAEQLLNKENELNTAMSLGSFPLYLSEDVKIIRTTEFVEAAGFINKFIAEYKCRNNQNKENLDASFVIYAKNQKIDTLINPLVDSICRLILENNELISLEANLMDSIILAYRKLHYLHYYDYYLYKKMTRE